MKSLLLAFFTMGLGLSVSGCGSILGCSALACSDSVRVTLAGILEKHASSAPLTVKVCVDGGSCTTASITDVNGVTTCEFVTGAPFDSCELRRDGKDIEIAILLDSTTAAKSEIKLSALVTDGTSAKLFEAEKSTAVESVQPNGDGCDPVCNQGTVSFTL